MSDDDLKDEVDAKMWEQLANRLQGYFFITLLTAVVALTCMSQKTARVAVWYFLAILAVEGFITFTIAAKADNLRLKTFDNLHQRIKKTIDEIEKLQNGKSK